MNLDQIKGMSRYTFKETMLFGAVGAAGFGMFFNGTLLEIVMSFFIGILIRCISCFLSKHKLNSFLNNAISAGSAALSAQLIHQVLPQTNVDIMVISSFMLLVPGLAITNAIRDTIAGDYVSGVARAVDAFLCASCHCGRGWFCDVFLDIGEWNYGICDFKSRNLFIPC